jgi:tetratricopeptide (TPR) repeat protein
MTDFFLLNKNHSNNSIMKTSITLCFIFFLSFASNAQQKNIDSILQKIGTEKNPNIRIDIIYALYFNTIETNPASGIEQQQKVLLLSQQQKDKIGEAMALSMTGANYRQLGNTIKAMEYNFKALEMAEQTGNLKLIAVINNALGNIYNDREDFVKAIERYGVSEAAATKIKDEKIQSFALVNLGTANLLSNKLDAALSFTQRAYELCLRNNYTDYLSSILTQLGSIQGKLNNPTLAVSYYNLAIIEAKKTNYPRLFYFAYNGLAKYYFDNKNNDSSIVYAKKAVEAVKYSNFPNLMVKPAKMLLDLYENTNSDSAIKYFKLYRDANENLFSTKAIQQTQLMTLEEEIRQRELSTEKKTAAENRKHNIQYVLIAIGIVTFIILYLLLSRRIITNTKVIEFFGVVALLIVFEFLNLFLHPLLENITNHSPFLMLLALVCIASLLVPLHHKLEHWATKKLVEKNKRIRLASAKKTIEELEKNG